MKALFFVVFVGLSFAAPENATVRLPFGDVVGRRYSALGVAAFWDIPFAEAPVDDLRWRPPQPWTAPFEGGALSATENLGTTCYQDGYNVGTFETEDCLVLNVFAPIVDTSSSSSSSSLLPVFVWLYGGAFEGGSASLGLYNGVLLSAVTQSVVVVPNYRVGPLGFLALRELFNESAGASAGNFGLLDQRCALEWVRDNIAAFGGDPQRVTLGGQSAGGQSVLLHAVSPASAGLFVQAVVQSAPLLTLELDAAFDRGEQWLAASPCSSEPDVLSCLRNLSGSAVTSIEADPNAILWWRPVIDGSFLFEDPELSFAHGNFTNVPMLIGVVRDEASLFIDLSTFGSMDIPAVLYEFTLQQVLPMIGLPGSLSQKIIDLYPPHNESNIVPSLKDIFSDFVFTCPARRVARSVQKAFLERFYWPPRCSGKYEGLGVFHGADVGFLFGTLPAGVTCATNATDEYITSVMQNYWGSFFNSGTPGQQPISWPQYTRQQDLSLMIDSTVGIESHMRAEVCAFWDSLVLPPESLSSWNQQQQNSDSSLNDNDSADSLNETTRQAAATALFWVLACIAICWAC